jgi:uncharacterized protein (TIGR00299 family) protein
MFIAAMLDAWPEFTEGLLACIRSADVSTDWQISVPDFEDGVFSGKRFLIAVPGDGPSSHHHRYEAIANHLKKSSLDPDVAETAVAIFDLLAQAEADVHGVPMAEVTFHEVGAWDSIGDIVGAAYLIQEIAPGSWTLGPLPTGGGRVKTAHGPMPVPSPAAAWLLQGFTMIDDGVPGERVTPTGAAILKYLAQRLGKPRAPGLAPLELRRVGTGFGARSLTGISNICRVMTFEAPVDARTEDQVGVIEFEVDDQSPEDLAVGIDSIRETDGVLDVIQIPAFGKKGRLVVHVRVLCLPRALDQSIENCFLQTTTIGLRWRVTARAILERDSVQSKTGTGVVAVKRVKRPGGEISAKADVECLRGRGGAEERGRIRGKTEEAALRAARSGDRCGKK